MIPQDKKGSETVLNLYKKKGDDLHFKNSPHNMNSGWRIKNFAICKQEDEGETFLLPGFTLASFFFKKRMFARQRKSIFCLLLFSLLKCLF